VTDRVERRPIRAIADRQAGDPRTVDSRDDRHIAATARRHYFAAGRIGSDARRAAAVGQRHPPNDLSASRVEDHKLLLILDVDEHPPSSIRNAELEGAADRNRRDNLRRDRIDHADVAAARVHHSHRSRSRIIRRSIELGSGRDRRANLARAPVEQGRVVALPVG
jgi:hypothetical protein